jgi:hypothetical protein
VVGGERRKRNGSAVLAFVHYFERQLFPFLEDQRAAWEVIEMYRGLEEG